MVNQKLKFVNLFRTIYFSPVVTTMIVVAIVWANLFNPDEGFINQFLKVITFGKAKPLSWFQGPKYAFPAIMVLSVWQGVGFQMIIFLAGLQDIPKELYESARVDGANKWQQFWSVTLPQLRNTTIFVVIATTILAFKLFAQVWVLTKGGPQRATMTTIVMLYRQGFRQLRVGYAATIGKTQSHRQRSDEMQIISDMSSVKGFIPYGEIGIQNYLDVFQRMNFGRFMFNSVFITSSTVESHAQ